MKVYEIHETTGRCQGLAASGQRCRKAAAWERSYHGDPEWNGEPSWVLVKLCDGCARGVWWTDFKKRRASGGNPVKEDP